jgi:hypothetical protein
MPVTTHNNKGRKRFTNQIVALGLFSGLVALAANLTLTKNSAQMLKLNPSGASRDVTLPAFEEGLFFHIGNTATAAKNLVVKNAAGTTICTINQNEEAIVFSSETAWVLFRVATIALS